MSAPAPRSPDFLFRWLFAPFLSIGAVWVVLENAVFGAFFGIWRGTRSLLRSPWGLILPITGIVVLCIAAFLEQQPQRLGRQLINAAATVETEELSGYFEQIRRLGNDAIPGLVHGMTIPREPLFFFCRDAFEERLRWAQHASSQEAEATYLLMTRSFEESVGFMDEPAQLAVLGWTQQILREILRRSDESFPQRERITARCEQLLDSLPNVAFKKVNPPVHAEVAKASPYLAKGEPRVYGENLSLWAATPTRPEHYDESRMLDRFDQPRAEELHAYYRSAGKTTTGPKSLPDALPVVPAASETLTPEMLAAVMHPPRQRTMPAPHIGTGDKKTPPAMQAATGEPKIASAVTERKAESLLPDIARSYLDKYQKEAAKELEEDDFENTSAMPRLELPDQPPPTNYPPVKETPLGRLPLHQLGNCTTAELLRLLHHSDRDYVEDAQMLLTTRDRIPNSHLRLLGQIFHPKPEVRLDLARRLPNLRTPRQSEWAGILLRDPNPQVRYAVISSLASSGDPEIQRLLAEQSKRETDARNAELFRQIREFRTAATR